MVLNVCNINTPFTCPIAVGIVGIWKEVISLCGPLSACIMESLQVPGRSAVEDIQTGVLY